MSDLQLEPYYEKSISKLDNFGVFSSDEFKKYSTNKELYDYQTSAIKNALRLLQFWSQNSKQYNTDIAKDELYKILHENSNGNIESHKLRLKQKDLGGEVFQKLEERYPIKERSRRGNSYREIDFKNFANQMGFWMATGSGKTLVLIKLMELMYRLMEKDLIPHNNLLLLVPSKEIKKQFKKEIKDYNSNGVYNIQMHDAENINNSIQNSIGNSLGKTIDLYVKRSDLISNETKDKEISFEDIENGGNWYVFLDEAHKGQSDSSKRQAYYSILARNGFMFNASATFTDSTDIATTVYNYNIEKFNSDGYGKNIFLADSSLESITDDSFDEKTKRKIVLQSLIALTVQKKSRKEVNQTYHNPLLTAFVNSVNTTDSDLERFFEIIEDIGENYNKNEFEKAKDGLSKMMRNSNNEFEFGSDNFKWNLVDDIEKEDLLQEIYNSDSHASLEVKHSPNNKKEIGFKLKSSSKPFALIKIGNNADWISDKLSDKYIEETYDFRSYFKSINEPDSPINILLGSRTFYEGWDSNRPNVMMFINLGRSDKKKLIMQAIGRGMRIEPEENIRKRAKYSNLDVKDESCTSTIESLLIFATSVDNLEDIINSFKWVREKEQYKKVKGIEKTDITQKLYVPTYEESELTDLNSLSKFEGDIDIINNYMDQMDNQLIMFHLNTDMKTINRMNMFIQNHAEKFISPKYEIAPIQQLRNLKNHISRKNQRPNEFKDANKENSIVHFNSIQIDTSSDKVSNDVLDEINHKVNNGVYESINIGSEKININNLTEHYYSPILYTDDKSDVFKHIIDVQSEYDFLQQVIHTQSKLFKDAEWWHFSTVSEHLDDVYIPYSGDKKFKPDFIFWIKTENSYKIIFIDPKSIAMADEQKIKGYKELFEDENGNKIKFNKDNIPIDIEVYLYMYNRSLGSSYNGEYANYWVRSLDDLELYIS